MLAYGILATLMMMQDRLESSQRLLHALRSRENSARLAALESISGNEVENGALVRTIIELLDDRDDYIHDQSERALARLKAWSVPYLIEALKNDDAARTKSILRALVLCGQEAFPALDSVKVLAKDRRDEVRYTAVRVLGQIRDESTIKLLMTLAKDDVDVEVRSAAIMSLGEFEEKGAPACSLLTQIMISQLSRGKEYKDRALGRDAALALTCIGRAAVPFLADMIWDQNQCERVRSAAIDGLATIGKEAWPACGALAKNLSDPSDIIRRKSAYALGQIGVGGNAVITALCYCAADSSAIVRQEAIRALIEVAPHNKVVLPLLQVSLRDKDAEVVRLVCGILPTLAANARVVVVGDLVECLERKELIVRQASIRALGNLGRDAEAALTALERLAAGGDARIVEEAREAIRKIRMGEK